MQVILVQFCATYLLFRVFPTYPHPIKMDTLSDDGEVYFMPSEYASEKNVIKEQQNVLKKGIEEIKNSVANLANNVVNQVPTTSSLKHSNDVHEVNYMEVEDAVSHIINKVVQHEKDVKCSADLDNVLRSNPYLCAQLSALVSKVNDMESAWSAVDSSVNTLLKKRNDDEQYGRLYNLILRHVKHVPYKLKGHRFSLWVVNLLNKLLGRYLFRPIMPNDIDKSHPLFKEAHGKYTLIVRFVIRDVRDDIFYNKHHLNHTNIVIDENLTEANKKLLKAAQAKLGKSCVKSDQGKIIALGIGKKRTVICSYTQLNEITVPNDRPFTLPVHNNHFSEVNSDVAAETDVFISKTLPTLLAIIANRSKKTGPYAHK